LRSLRFKTPTHKSKKLFDDSFDTILVHYAANLKQLPNENVHPKDLDFDTGRPTSNCEYSLADQTYCDWLLKLEDDKFKNIDPKIKQNIISFFQLSNTRANSTYSKQCAKFFTACKELIALQ
jgi:hypothetical protein